MSGSKQIASAFALLALPLAAAHASEPDEIVRARYMCDACSSQWPNLVKPCLAVTADGGLFGDVIVRLTPAPGARHDNVELASGTIATAATDGLGTKVARCVEERLRQSDCIAPCYVDLSFPVDIPVGDPRPLLPDAADLVVRWRTLKGSSWLTHWWRSWRFKRALPADVRLTPDECLWIPQAANLRAGLDAWERHVGREIPAATLAQFKRGSTTPQWQPSWDRGHQIAEAEAILVDYGPVIDDRRDWREYDGTAGIRICLVPSPGAR